MQTASTAARAFTAVLPPASAQGQGDPALGIGITLVLLPGFGLVLRAVTPTVKSLGAKAGAKAVEKVTEKFFTLRGLLHEGAKAFTHLGGLGTVMLSGHEPDERGKGQFGGNGNGLDGQPPLKSSLGADP